MIIGVDVVFIHVKNPEKMAEWYQEKLGLEIDHKTPDLGWQEFKMGDERPITRFALDYGGTNPSQVEQQPIVISFKVSNIKSAVEQLEQKGIEFFGEEKISDVGPTLVATFKDPEGNFLQLSQRK
ncbi:MAG: VOC family protein [Candidatus Heimdallarchaeota archaeon]|nr:VOC family protein [Candidatus Heimdallarchaeota archaeon]MBY8993143.1 VOC family protein [Candidatus Heimdallarchaeota archaeon]